mmetsp:Transcript_26898/g.59047  ORF Transcript_26898/g.59047 Transcript_26898/m.59047 type:complete len:226 (+) Transcript_26898:1968-2645(+)
MLIFSLFSIFCSSMDGSTIPHHDNGHSRVPCGKSSGKIGIFGCKTMFPVVSSTSKKSYRRLLLLSTSLLPVFIVDFKSLCRKKLANKSSPLRSGGTEKVSLHKSLRPSQTNCRNPEPSLSVFSPSSPLEDVGSSATGDWVKLTASERGGVEARGTGDKVCGDFALDPFVGPREEGNGLCLSFFVLLTFGVGGFFIPDKREGVSFFVSSFLLFLLLSLSFIFLGIV